MVSFAHIRQNRDNNTSVGASQKLSAGADEMMVVQVSVSGEKHCFGQGTVHSNWINA